MSIQVEPGTKLQQVSHIATVALGTAEHLTSTTGTTQ